MNNKFLSDVFKWLCIGLLITFASGYIASTSRPILELLFNKSMYMFVIIAELVLAIVLSARINKMSKNTAIVCYLSYTLLTGLTFASIFLLFRLSSIIYVFLATSLVFGIFAVIGKKTNLDLSKIGVYLLVGLIAVIILEIINIFLLNNALDMITTVISLVVFIAYVAYDIQKITRFYNGDNLAIYGAFELYLDFINIFLDLLRLFGKSRD